jgi:ABC-type transport system substrate-binding protein
MGNFDQAAARLQSFYDAQNVPRMYRGIYDQSKVLITFMTRYQVANDPPFNAAIDALFTSAERNELGAMLAAVQALINDWETNHPAAVHGGI